ncbi:MAG: serine/threonine-protein kinase [Candidatus Asgardarchaeum sp.]
MRLLKIPRYKLLRLIGAGGFSEVWLAERNHKYYAIKIPKIDVRETLSSKDVEDFLRKAEIWSKLNHKNIVRVFEFGIKPFPYIVMEYCETSLREKIGELKLSEALRIALKIAEALEYAHLHGVVHCDIKPENILFCNNEPKLSDWGIAKVLLRTSTKIGYVGTPMYSAPEQIDPETYGEIDWRTDIWQFGCLLYEMIEKEPPFYANYPGQLILKILNETLRSFKKTPEWLKLIILKCLEKKREERWRSISVLIEMLKTKQKPEVVPVAIEIKKASTEKLVKTEYFDNNIHDKIMNILQKMYSWYLKYRRMYGGKESE